MSGENTTAVTNPLANLITPAVKVAKASDGSGNKRDVGHPAYCGQMLKRDATKPQKWTGKDWETTIDTLPLSINADEGEHYADVICSILFDELYDVCDGITDLGTLLPVLTKHICLKQADSRKTGANQPDISDAKTWLGQYYAERATALMLRPEAQVWIKQQAEEHGEATQG